MSMFPDAHHFNISGGQFNNVQGNQYNVSQVPMDVGQKLFNKLNPVMNAYISPEKFCLEGTRTEIIKNITDWIYSPVDNPPRIFFLQGPAGTGKSAISHTMGRIFQKSECLGAFFSFDCTFNAERTPSRAIHSIAYNLGLHSAAYGECLIEVMDKYPYILYSSTLEEEWEKLILYPAKRVTEQKPVVIIIDALDECGTQKKGGPRERFISLLLGGVHDLPQHFHILVTSRLEWDVAYLLEGYSEGVQIQDMSELSGVNEDIYAYVCKRMSSPIQSHHGLDQTQCKLLAERAEGLFQWAYTVCEALVGGPQGGIRIKEHFEHFMSLASSLQKGLQPLDAVYKSILHGNFDHQNEAVMQEYRIVMSQVLAASQPLSQSSLKKFQSAYLQFTGEGNTQQSVDVVVPFLGSLLTGVGNMDIPVRPIHTSVRDFLLDESRSGEYAIDLSNGHNTMGIGTIHLMIEKLHFNMCNLPSSYLPNSEVNDLKDRILEGISEDLSYACCFWDAHLANIEPSQAVLSLLKKFLYYFSLYWMEVLSILGEVPAIPRILKNVKQWIQLPIVSLWSGSLQLLIDEMKHFVAIFGRVMVEATPHMYLSALPFIPRHSILQKIYCSHFAKTAVVCSGEKMHWPSLEVILDGHTGYVTSVAFSPDGKKIVSGSRDRSVRIWDAETGKAARTPLEGHTSFITSVALSPDGKKIVSGSMDDSVRIWDAETGKAEGSPLQGHGSGVRSVAFSPDGKKIVSGSDDNSVRIWNAETGKVVGNPLQGHESGVRSVAFSPDGKKIVSGSEDRSVRIWDAETGKAKGTPLQCHGPVSSVAFSPDGKKILCGSQGNFVRIWDADTGSTEGKPLQGCKHHVSSVVFSPNETKYVAGSWDNLARIWVADTSKAETNPLHGHKHHVCSVAYSLDGKKIVSGSSDKYVRIWDAETRNAEGNPLQGHTGPVSSVAFSPDGKKIVSGSWDNFVRIWDAEPGKVEDNPLQSHTSAVTSVAFSPDGRKIVSGSWDNSVRIWDAETGKAEGNPLRGHKHFSSVSFSPDGKKLVSGSWDNSVRIWDVVTGKAEGNPLKGHKDNVTSVAFSHDGKKVVSGSWDNSVRIWDVETGMAEGSPLQGHKDYVNSVAFSPDGKKIVSGSSDKSIRIWDAETGKVKGNPLQGHASPVNSVAFSLDGRKIVSGSIDNSVRIWDVETGKAEGNPIQGHTSNVKSVAFSPDGKRIVSGSDDRSVRIWNAETGKPEGNPLQGHGSGVRSVAFSPDGKRIVSGSEDMSVRIWDAETAKAEETDTSSSATVPTSANIKYSLSFCPWHNSHHHLHSSSSLQMVSLQHNGWLCGSDSSLIIWIPPEYRNGLLVPPLQVLISSSHMRSLNLQNFVHGIFWAQCYTGLQLEIDSQSVELLEQEISSQQ